MIDEKLKSDISSIATNSQELLSRCISSLDEIDKANSKAIKDIEARTNNLVKSFSNSFEIAVGVEGDFTDLEEAINYASIFKSVNNSNILIVILPTYEFTKRVFISNRDLKHVYITTKNEVVNIKLDYADVLNSWYFAFCFYNTHINFYQCNFNYAGNDTVNASKFLFANFSTVSFDKCTLSGFKDFAINIQRGSAFVENSNINNCNIAIIAYCSSVDVRICTIQDCKEALRNHQGFLSCMDSKLIRCSLGINSFKGHTSLFETTFSEVTTEANIAYNTLTPNGIIFK